ncbi:hypothetical protein B0H67DRAFT_584280 [Lasiosphaeris hirsuta]|uniref:Serine/threonine-protein kinase ppk6 n=1 Tax=Lasiosphaeris hirsuta TaxID=260670 RepID=A0AA40A8M0_9PEZI|nr:hypothetical protein B0H67DRAFT_584280 [Lasiosphaeris hirsuta]
MSADLFAAFEPPRASKPQQNQTSSANIPAEKAGAADPFSFLASILSAPQSQNGQQISQWPPLHQQPIAQASWSAWPPAQADPPQSTSVWGDLAGLTEPPSGQNAPAAGEEDDDGWGDFETAATHAPQPRPALSTFSSMSSAGGVGSTGSMGTATAEPPRTRLVRASTIDLMTNKLLDIDLTSSTLEPWQQRPSWEKTESVKSPPKAKQSPNPNVLFDADDFDGEGEGDDDDFGDFETVGAPASIPVAVSAKPTVDLLSATISNSTVQQPKKQPPGLTLTSMSLTSSPPSYPQAPKSPYGSFQTRKPEQVKQLKVKTPLAPEFPIAVKEASPSPVTAWPSVEQDGFDDEWAEFEDKPAPQKSMTKQPAQDWGWGESEKEKPKSKSAALPSTTTDMATGPPPTNIPPPSVLLSAFPQLLDLANTSLLKPINALPASSQQRVLADTATAVFLRSYLALATVAGRIIAGRKPRWHRDKFLMQGMAISAAGGKGGMKLAGVDRTQAAREDREAAEVVAVWKAQVGRLRTAVAAANANGALGSGGALKVPELNATLAAHAVQGVLTAPKACVVCGLKRDERIAKVDFDVEDSFGEWWVEFWGHRACRNFWLEHEVKLRQR